jgi:hypothetical protein
MSRHGRLAAIVALLAVSLTPALADTLVLKSGTRVSGYFEGGTARVVRFRGADGQVRDYDIGSVQQVLFEDASTPAAAAAPATPAVAPAAARAAAPAAAATPATSSADPRLRPASERPPAQPASSSAAATGYTVPTGEKVVIRMVDSINSETHKLGATFVAVLDEAIVLNGIEVAPKGSDVRGRISNINEAGRIAGAAELGLELTQIYVNGIPYSMTTSEYAEVGENRGGQTARRAGLGAGVGAVIGAIAGGGKGAAIGAGIGAGGATAVQVMTKGEKLNIPAETKLEFSLRAPLVIAAR